MHPMATEPQAEVLPEARVERAAVTLTRSEKESVRLVAMVDKTDESALFRAALPEILARAEQIRAKIEAA
jgi:hypothetical protein